MIQTIQLPDILSYPPILNLDQVPELKDHMVYVVKAYEQNGISVLLINSKDEIAIRFGDWDGNPIEPNKTAVKFLEQYNERIIKILRTIGVVQCILYITSNMELVDVRLSLNKFSGPGMIRDLFGKVIQTQEIVKIEIMDDQLSKAIIDGTGNYTGDLIIKSSTFNTIVRNKELIPLYALVQRA